jgi:hypothetical protein
MPDLRPGVISDTAKKPSRARAVTKKETEAMALINAMRSAEDAGRAQGVEEARSGDPCAALAPEKCRCEHTRAAWVDGYIAGWSATVKAQEQAVST